MKNKTRIIDVSMLSSYMGRWLTLVVTVFVVIIALSALLGGGISSRRDIIRVCVPDGLHPGESIGKFEPLRALLSRETRRAVVLSENGGRWRADFDLYVMPVDEFLRHRDALAISALFEIGSSDRRPDKAILISVAENAASPLDDVTAHDVAFTHPSSINGFWLQADALEGAGVHLEGADLNFEGAVDDGTPVVYSVVHGGARWGACRLSDLASLTDRGIVHAESIRVAYAEDALPEIVIGAREADADYYMRTLTAVADLLDVRGAPAQTDKTVGLLVSNGVRRLDPVDEAGMARAAGLFTRFGAWEGADRTIKP